MLFLPAERIFFEGEPLGYWEEASREGGRGREDSGGALGEDRELEGEEKRGMTALYPGIFFITL